VELSYVEELRLTAFKSFREAVLPLDEFTLVVGRNGSGKSNALDGLWVLSRLAHDEDIRDALDGGREGPAVRGGVAGCAPFGASSFALGATVRTGDDVVRFDVEIQTEPHVQVVYERLSLDGHDLLITDPANPDSSDIRAAWGTASGDRSAKETFRAGRLLIGQVLARVPATEDGRRVHLAAAQVMGALRSVFVLDPVPHLMRQYVPARDSWLRRDADNLSAAVGSLLESPATKELIRRALHDLNEQEVLDVTVSRSDLGDLMLTAVEQIGGHRTEVPARVMSDGTLRFLAILTSVLQAPTVDTMPEHLASDDAAGQTTVVIEELENGLHASQAATLITLIRDQVSSRRVRALATAHSPAVLDALTGDEHRSVIICQRSADGASRLTRLVDLADYWKIAAVGSLGRAAEDDRLRDAPDDRRDDRDARAVLDDILGRSASS